LLFHIIKTNPRVAGDFLKGTVTEDFNDLTNRPLQAPASEITSGTGTSYRLFTVDNIKTLIDRPLEITTEQV
jgi:hypothetical protein